MKKESIEKQITTLLAKHKMGMTFGFKFPGLDKPPFIARVAFWILNRTNFALDIQITPLNNKK